ncbi:unnamed protein product [Closterium sp. Naga37s-1]|nr:unnamed protein product [Closterium sp. Naga37s-1]
MGVRVGFLGASKAAVWGTTCEQHSSWRSVGGAGGREGKGLKVVPVAVGSGHKAWWCEETFEPTQKRGSVGDNMCLAQQLMLNGRCESQGGEGTERRKNQREQRQQRQQREQREQKQQREEQGEQREQLMLTCLYLRVSAAVFIATAPFRCHPSLCHPSHCCPYIAGLPTATSLLALPHSMPAYLMSSHFHGHSSLHYSPHWILLLPPFPTTAHRTKGCHRSQPLLTAPTAATVLKHCLPHELQPLRTRHPAATAPGHCSPHSMPFDRAACNHPLANGFPHCNFLASLYTLPLPLPVTTFEAPQNLPQLSQVLVATLSPHSTMHTATAST